MDPNDPRARRTRTAILDAAVRVLCESGIAAATMDGVAVDAGVSRSTLYRHFESFGALLVAALDQIAPPSPPVDGTLPEQLDALVRGLGHALRDGAWGRMVGSILERAERDPEVRRYHAAFTEARRRPMVVAIDRAAAEGTFVGRVDAEWLTTTLVAPLYYRHLVLHDPMEDAEVAQHVATTLSPLMVGVGEAG